MKKPFIFLFLISCSCFAQLKNGVVEYGALTIFDKSTQTTGIQNEIEKTETASGQYTFTLNFIPTESYFFVNPSLGTQNQSPEEFCSNAMIKTGYYTAPSKNEYRHTGTLNGTGYVTNQEKKAYWQLSNETKMIGGYLCYKATSIYYNQGWDDNPKFTVTAWYTPKIPVPYGPNGYHGLPGLILEVETYTTTLYVKKIQLSLDSDPKIDRLEEGTVMTREQVTAYILDNSPQELRGFVENDIAKRNAKSDAIAQRIAAEKAGKKTD